MEHGDTANTEHTRGTHCYYYWCSLQTKFNSAGNIFVWYNCATLGCCRCNFLFKMILLCYIWSLLVFPEYLGLWYAFFLIECISLFPMGIIILFTDKFFFEWRVSMFGLCCGWGKIFNLFVTPLRSLTLRPQPPNQPYISFTVGNESHYI